VADDVELVKRFAKLAQARRRGSTGDVLSGSIIKRSRVCYRFHVDKQSDLIMANGVVLKAGG
jgi:hypothetical protein